MFGVFVDRSASSFSNRIEISKAFEDEQFTGFKRDRIEVRYAGMMQYDGDLKLPHHFLACIKVMLELKRVWPFELCGGLQPIILLYQKHSS